MSKGSFKVAIDAIIVLNDPIFKTLTIIIASIEAETMDSDQSIGQYTDPLYFKNVLGQ